MVCLDGFPVCTGIDLIVIHAAYSVCGFPRVYGDRPYPALSALRAQMVSPCVRG